MLRLRSSCRYCYSPPLSSSHPRNSFVFSIRKERRATTTSTNGGNENSALMVASTSFVVGTLAGLLGSLAGMGGGFVMIPLMTTSYLPLRLTQHAAHGTSLFAVAATGLAGAYSYGSDTVQWYPHAVAVAGTAMITAPLGAYATLYMSSHNLKLALGYLMLVVAPAVPAKAYYLQYLEQQQQQQHGHHMVTPQRNSPDDKADAEQHLSRTNQLNNGDTNDESSPIPTTQHQSFLAPALIGIGSGFLSGLFGVGGGTIVVPALTLCTDMTHHQALGTSLAAMILPAVAGTMTHYRAGNCSMRVAPYLAFGAIVGAYTGAQASLQTNEIALRWGFSVLLATLGLRTVLKA